jgi:hypothetical protein
MSCERQKCRLRDDDVIRVRHRIDSAEAPMTCIAGRDRRDLVQRRLKLRTRFARVATGLPFLVAGVKSQ